MNKYFLNKNCEFVIQLRVFFYLFYLFLYLGHTKWNLCGTLRSKVYARIPFFLWRNVSITKN